MDLEQCTIQLREAARTLSRVIVALEEIELETLKAKLEAEAGSPERLRESMREYLSAVLPDEEKEKIEAEHGLVLPPRCTRSMALQLVNTRDRAAIAAFGGLDDDAGTEITDNEANELISSLLDIIDDLVFQLNRKNE